MEQEPMEESYGAENVSAIVENGQRYLTDKEEELGLENIRPEVIIRAQEILFSLGG